MIRHVLGNGCAIMIMAMVGFVLLLHPFVMALGWTLRTLTWVLG